MAKRDEILKPGHVVEEFYIGKTHVKICDDYCRDKTPEDVKKILDDLAKKLLPYMIEAEKTYTEEDWKRVRETKERYEKDSDRRVIIYSAYAKTPSQKCETSEV